MRGATDVEEQAHRCRNLLFSVVRQALIDHRTNLQSARRELNAMRKRKNLPMATDCEALEHAMKKEPAIWILSDDIGRMLFRWCCDQVELDPAWVRLRMNSRQFGFSLDRNESKAA